MNGNTLGIAVVCILRIIRMVLRGKSRSSVIMSMKTLLASKYMFKDYSGVDMFIANQVYPKGELTLYVKTIIQ